MAMRYWMDAPCRRPCQFSAVDPGCDPFGLFAGGAPDQAENAGRTTSAILQTEGRITMNLMSRKYLLNQAACSPKIFDDVHEGRLDDALEL